MRGQRHVKGMALLGAMGSYTIPPKASPRDLWRQSLAEPHQSNEIRDIFVASCIGVRMHAQRTDSVTFSFRATVSIPASAPHR